MIKLFPNWTPCNLSLDIYCNILVDFRFSIIKFDFSTSVHLFCDVDILSVLDKFIGNDIQVSRLIVIARFRVSTE